MSSQICNSRADRFFFRSVREISTKLLPIRKSLRHLKIRSFYPERPVDASDKSFPLYLRISASWVE